MSSGASAEFLLVTFVVAPLVLVRAVAGIGLAKIGRGVLLKHWPSLLEKRVATIATAYQAFGTVAFAIVAVIIFDIPDIDRETPLWMLLTSWAAAQLMYCYVSLYACVWPHRAPKHAAAAIEWWFKDLVATCLVVPLLVGLLLVWVQFN